MNIILVRKEKKSKYKLKISLNLSLGKPTDLNFYCIGSRSFGASVSFPRLKKNRLKLFPKITGCLSVNQSKNFCSPQKVKFKKILKKSILLFSRGRVVLGPALAWGILLGLFFFHRIKFSNKNFLSTFHF